MRSWGRGVRCRDADQGRALRRGCMRKTATDRPTKARELFIQPNSPWHSLLDLPPPLPPGHSLSTNPRTPSILRCTLHFTLLIPSPILRNNNHTTPAITYRSCWSSVFTPLLLPRLLGLFSLPQPLLSPLTSFCGYCAIPPAATATCFIDKSQLRLPWLLSSEHQATSGERPSPPNPRSAIIASSAPLAKSSDLPGYDIE